MPTDHILALLIAERDKLDRAIAALQGAAKRRGRPAKASLETAPANTPAAPKRKRRKFSAAQREAAAERMRQRWAKRKAGATGKAKRVAKKSA